MTYELGQSFDVGFGRVTNVEDAAPELAAVAQEAAASLGRGMKIRPRKSNRGALIELRVDGFADIGMMTYPCTLHVKRLFKSSVEEELKVAGICKRAWN